MTDLHQLLFDKGRVGKVLAVLGKPCAPDPVHDPDHSLIYGHALLLFGDLQQARKVYAAIPPDPAWDAERQWGLGNSYLLEGNLKQAAPLLDDALVRNPSDWVLSKVYNSLTQLYLYTGQFEQALQANEQGISAAQRGGHLIEQLVLEGNRGAVKEFQGSFEEAAFIFQKAAKELLVRDCILSAATLLINLGGIFETLGVRYEALKCLGRAEELIQKSGSKGRLITVRLVQGNLLERDGLLDKAERTYKEALELLRDLPHLQSTIWISCRLASLHFEKGDRSASLAMIREAIALVRDKGYKLLEDTCLATEGEFLLRSGATEEGLAVLHQARELAESLGKKTGYWYIALNLCRGYEQLKQRKQALHWLEKCFEVTKLSRQLPELLLEGDHLTSLLLKLGAELPQNDFLSQVVIQIRHPGLTKRLLQGPSEEGKMRFLRALNVHDARHFRTQLVKLNKDPGQEVRRSARSLLKAWQQHVGYRVHTLGTFRAFLEGKMVTDSDWIRPGVKRLFLYLASNPEEWLTTDSLLETLWVKPHPQKTKQVLEKLFSYLRSSLEPWHLPGMDYIFFQSQRGAYGFFPGDRFWIDYQQFEQGIKHAEQTQLTRNFKEARKAYREALNLYLGDYLEEFPYEDWLVPKRDYLRELYFRGVMRYATLERDSGNLSEARRVLEDALFKDLSRSGCAAFLIQVLVQMKLIQEAREWGQRHITYLKKELKEKPAPEVMEELSKLG